MHSNPEREQIGLTRVDIRAIVFLSEYDGSCL